MASFISPIPLARPSSYALSSSSSLSSSLYPIRTIRTRKTRRISTHCCLSADVAETDAKKETHVSPTQLVDGVRLPQGARRASYEWNGHEISYIHLKRPSGSTSIPGVAAIVLVHGFGGNALHWRSTINALDSYDGDVYSLDLLGFGNSAKPILEPSIDRWGEQISHFIETIAASPAILVGNSIGSLSCLSAAANGNSNSIRAIALMNCAGGLVSFRESEVSLPARILIRAINAVLFNSVVGGWLFRWIRQPKNLRNVLTEIYSNSDRVDDELINIISAPAFTDGACEVFLSVFNAKDAGPTPESLLARCTDIPVCLIWGEQDMLTPLRSGVHPGINFPDHHPNLTLHPIESCGHVPFDDSPEKVEGILLPFLKEQSKSPSPPS